jgi:excisionase family DNA binding protein
MNICSTAISPEGLKPLAVTVKTARDLLGVGNTTIWAMIKNGRLRTINIGRRRLIVYASLEAITTEGQVA